MRKMNIRIIGILFVLFSFLLAVVAISANAITVSGTVTDTSGNIITAGVTVTGYWQHGTPVSTSTTNGSFSLPGIPSSTQFYLVMSSPGYVDIFTQALMNTGDFSLGTSSTGSVAFLMPTVDQLTAQGVMPQSGKGVLFGHVVDGTYSFSSYVKGAVVTAADRNGKTYPVTYMGFNGLGGSSTYQNGIYYVLNVDPAATMAGMIDLQASKSGWTFGTPTASFYPVANSEGVNRLKGVAPAYDVSIGGSLTDLTGTPISGATIALKGDEGKNTTSAGDGTFSLGNLPSDATFYLEMTGIGYVPTLVGPITLQTNLSDVSAVTMTPADMAAKGVTGNNGIVLGRVVDPTGTPISGATIVVASKLGASYTVYYDGDGSSTSATGQFAVPNVQPGDSVKIQVTSAGYDFLPVIMDCWSASITETTIFASLLSVDVSQIYYSDSIRTINNYDFSAGTKSGDIITIPAGFVTTSESGLSYTFGLYPGSTGYTLSWTAPGPCTLQGSSADNGAAIISTTGGTPDPASAQATWSYGIILQNFTYTGSGEISTINTGLGAPSGNNQPEIAASWLANGDLQLQADIGGNGDPSWQSSAVTLPGLTPSTTTLGLQVQNTGSAINFSYELNGGSVTAIGTYTIPESTTILGFPVLFPFVSLEVENAPPVMDPFQVFSFHENNNNNQYSAGIFVNDPGQATYASISVASSGTPCGDNLPSTALTYNGAGQWWLSPGVFLSQNTPPGCYPSYTFTAVQNESAGGGTVTETRTITGYVQDFATNLLPTGTVTGTPTFSWTGITGANGYTVELSDNPILHQIWGAVVDTPQTSVVYSGPALVSGQTYYYYVNSNISTNGVSNQSIAEGSFTYSSSPSPLYATFTGNGVWMYDGTTWSQLTPGNPTSMVVSGSLLYGNFGAGGLWQWNGTAWSQVNAVAPTSMVVSGSLLYGNFGAGGLWQWNGTAWSQVNAVAPSTMVASGSILYGDFGVGGLWQWNGTAWSQVNAVAPNNMVASSSILYGDFGAGGLWQWNGTAWSQVNAVAPTSMVVSGSLLYGNFGAGGLWQWNGTAWSQVNAVAPNNMVASSSILYGDFGAGGLWQWNGTAWSQVNAVSPASMVTGP